MNSVKIKGRVKIECLTKDGKLKWSTGWKHNTITNAGLAQLALLAGDATAVPFTYLAVGTDNTAAAASQTALIAEIVDSGLARGAATVSRVTTTQTNDTLQLYKEWTASGSKTVEEVGIFNDSSAGTMLGRKLTTSKAIISGEKLQATYQIIFA